jgi:ribokinase
MKTPHIIVIGSSNTDFVCRVPEIPKPGQTILGSQLDVVQGGKGANQAVAAARAGANVTFIACVGNDALGQQAVQGYKNEGIDTSCITIIEEVSTGTALINVSESGENSISVAPGANNYLTPGIIDRYSHVITSADYILMQLEIPLDTVVHVIELAHSKGKKIILNPAPARALPFECLKKVTLITPNQHEALIMAGLENNSGIDKGLAQGLLSKGVGAFVITLGDKGAYFYNHAMQRTIQGIKVTNVVDTVGAGDTFNGYLAVELAKGTNIGQAIEIANKAAAICVTRKGAQPSIPFKSELDVIN